MNPSSAPQCQTNPGRARILLVDDDPAVRSSLSRALESEGYFVVSAATAAEALHHLSEQAIDLVLLDLNLPVLNGWDLFDRIFGLRPLLPVIIITARPDQYELAATAGATGVMEKPLSLPLLISGIDRVVHEPVQDRLDRLYSHQLLDLNASPSASAERGVGRAVLQSCHT